VDTLANGGRDVQAEGESAHAAAAAHVDTRLLIILNMVGDWLKFAEAKNAGLVVLTGTGITAILTLLTGDRNPGRPVELGLIWTEIFLSLSLLLATYSFLPKLLPPVDTTMEPADSQAPANYYFYGDLAKCASSDMLIAAIAGERREYPPSESDRYLANQIIANSRIATRKFRIFSLSASMAYLAVAPIPIVLLIELVGVIAD